MSAAMAKAKGTAQPTKPVYRLGGWMIIYAFCSRGFMPCPSKCAPEVTVQNGLAAKSISTAKNIVIDINVAMT
jgi:hypothetical protein